MLDIKTVITGGKAACLGHAQLSPAEQLATGVTPGLVRLAVGIEGIDDILADLERGFAAAKPLTSATAADPHASAAF